MFTHGEEPVSQEGVSSYSYRSKMSGKQRRKVLMNRNDMPFLGVYDNVRYCPNCTPTYQHWGWGFVSEHFVPQVFSRLPRARDGRFELHPLSCIYILTAVSLWSCIGKKTSCRYEMFRIPFLHPRMSHYALQFCGYDSTENPRCLKYIYPI